MAYLIGAFIGALVLSFLLTRLFLWGLKRLGVEANRVPIAYGIAYVLMVGLGGLGLSGGFLWAAEIYTPALIVWLVVDLLAARGRRAKAAAGD